MPDLTRVDPKIERFERFQALQAGHYWRALIAVPEHAIDKDEVLLIESIKWVDNAPHTIVVRAHPSKHGSQVRVELTKADGSIRQDWVRCGEHRFLLKDFLAAFEFEPDHKAVRTREVMAVQGRISLLQEELVRGQSDPHFFAQIAHEEHLNQRKADMRREGATEAEIDAHLDSTSPAAAQPVAQAPTNVAAAIANGITPQRIAELREQIGQQGLIAEVQAKWITGKTNEIAETIKALTPYYKEQAAAALASTEDVRKQVEKLMAGIESLDLYVGKDVVVNTVISGRSADRSEPLTFVQKKLMIDEELAVWLDLDEWFDFEDEDLFFQALREHESLIDQLFPTERCVIVMAATRRSLDYGNSFTNAARNEKNRNVFLMVRDGENIHQVISPVESHLKAARLFPSLNDQQGVFAGVDGTQITFEDVAYTDKLEAHERYALHYKRFLLLVCGLDHRQKLFGDFYDGPQSLDFVTMAFQEAHCRFLHDDDGTNLLPGVARQSVGEWISEMNNYLRSGSRVLCRWYAVMNDETAPGACKRESYNGRSEFRFAYRPVLDSGVAIAFRDGQNICVSVEVQSDSYSFKKARKFNCKVNLSAVRQRRFSSEDQIPYLCLDAVTPEDLHWYIHNRGSRTNHLAYIRYFKEALRIIQAERDEERDTRQRMFQALADGQIASGNEADGIIQQAVIAWRAANRGNPLPKFDNGAAPKGWKQLLDQMYLLAGEGQRQAEAVAQYVATLGYQPLRLVLSGAGNLVIYAAPQDHERDDRIESHPWVIAIQIEMTLSGAKEKSRSWRLLPSAAAAETTLHEWTEAQQWAGNKSIFTSYDHKQKIFSFAEQGLAKLQQLVTGTCTAGTWEVLFEDWLEAREAATGKYVVTPGVAFPIGVIRAHRADELRYVGIGLEDAARLLDQLAPSTDYQKKLRDAYCKPFANKDRGRIRFESAKNEQYPWQLLEVDMKLHTSAHSPFTHDDLGTWQVAFSKESIDPSLDNWLIELRKKAKENKASLWLCSEVENLPERALDQMLRIAIPADYSPTVVRTVHINRGGEERTRWFDLYPAKEKPTIDVTGNFTSYSSSGRTEMTFAMALAHAVDSARQAGKRLVSSSEVEGHSPLPEGVIERWIEVDIQGGRDE